VLAEAATCQHSRCFREDRAPSPPLELRLCIPAQLPAWLPPATAMGWPAGWRVIFGISLHWMLFWFAALAQRHAGTRWLNVLKNAGFGLPIGRSGQASGGCIGMV